MRLNVEKLYFVKHDLKGVLKYRGRNLDPSQTVTDIAGNVQLIVYTATKYYKRNSSVYGQTGKL
jgi:hypothetical protein